MSQTPAPNAEDRAILRLLLRRGQSYEQIAAALASDVPAVRARAHAALGALVPYPPELSATDRAQLSDHLLAGDTVGASGLLATSAAGASWWSAARARLVAEDLADAGRVPPPPIDAPVAGSLHGGAAPGRVSRRGGRLILAGAGLVLALLAAALIGGFFSSGSKPPPTPARAPDTKSTATTGAVITKQINLRAPNGARSPLGVVIVVEQDGKRALQVLGQGLAAGNMYALWLHGAGRWSRLGFFPAVAAQGNSAGRLTGLVAAPAGLAQADRIVVSRETSQTPSRPAAIVLSGRVSG